MDNEVKDPLDNNLSAVRKMRDDFERVRLPSQKLVDAVAEFVGSTMSLYCHVGFYLSWGALSLFGNQRSFGHLGFAEMASAASLESIFLAVFVLINQQRMQTLERVNSDFHLQMSVISEHEITRIARIIDKIARKLDVENPELHELEGVKADLNADEVLRQVIEHHDKT